VSDDECNNSSLTEDRCAMCLEKYNRTGSPSDWILCVSCRKWLHESCGEPRFAERCGHLRTGVLAFELAEGVKTRSFAFLLLVSRRELVYSFCALVLCSYGPRNNRSPLSPLLRLFAL
jgi:hypothetical protein